MNRLLYKLITRSFYRTNAGFFLFFFFLFFGAVNAGSLVSYHYSLILSMIISWLVLGAVFFCWILYQLKCLRYCYSLIRSAEGSFLFNFSLLSKWVQGKTVLIIYLQLYAAILIYSLVVMLIAFQRNDVPKGVALIA